MHQHTYTISTSGVPTATCSGCAGTRQVIPTTPTRNTVGT